MADDDVKDGKERDESSILNAIPLFVKNPVLKYFHSTGEFPETYEQLKENDPTSPMPKPDTIEKYGGLERVVEFVKQELKEQETHSIQSEEDEIDPRSEQDTEIDPFKRKETSYDQERSPGVRIELQEGMQHSGPHDVGKKALENLARDYSGVHLTGESKDEDAAEEPEEDDYSHDDREKEPLKDEITQKVSGADVAKKIAEAEEASRDGMDEVYESVSEPVDDDRVEEPQDEEVQEVTDADIEEVIEQEEPKEQKSVIVSPEMDPERDIMTRPEVPSESPETYSEGMSTGKKWGVIGTVTAALLLGGYFLLDAFKGDKKEEPVKEKAEMVTKVDEEYLKKKQQEKSRADEALKKYKEQREKEGRPIFEKPLKTRPKEEEKLAEETKPDMETLEQRCVESTYTQIEGKVKADHPLSKAQKYNLSRDGKEKISAQGLINTAYWYGSRKFGKKGQRWSGGHGTKEQFKMAGRWLAEYGIDIRDLIKRRGAEINPSMIDADDMTLTAGNDACRQYRTKKDKSGHNMHDSQGNERLASTERTYNRPAAHAYDTPAIEPQDMACVEETYLESVLNQRSELGISVERLTRKDKDGNKKTSFRYRHRMREGVAGTWVSRTYVREAVAALHEYDDISASDNVADRMRSIEIVSKYFTKESAEHACRG
ncbi:hypothetical protein KY349_01700 [Candidatus Woesearchaeota archaeon]|nr:hypothetical protein [Candidatus Woesearchaeota archaeon]